MTSIFENKYAELSADVGAPLLAIAAYSAQQGLPVGNGATVLAAVLAGAAIPVFNRFLLKPLFKALKLDGDRFLMLAFRLTASATLGLGFAMWLIPSAPV